MTLERRLSKLEQDPEVAGPITVWAEDRDDPMLFHNRTTGEVATREQLNEVPGRKIVVTREKEPPAQK